MADRLCRLCLMPLPEEAFELLPTGTRRHQCEMCLHQRALTRQRERWQKDPAYAETRNAAARVRRATTGYNAKQGSYRRRRQERMAGTSCPPRCEVCGQGFVQGGRRDQAAAYDHNHDTNKFRGWLCSRCNAALGHAGENPRILDRLAAYLRQRSHYTTRPVIS